MKIRISCCCLMAYDGCVHVHKQCQASSVRFTKLCMIRILLFTFYKLKKTNIVRYIIIKNMASAAFDNCQTFVCLFVLGFNVSLTLFHHFSLNLRKVYIVWSLVRRRVTRRFTRLQTMCNVLKYRKYFKTLRCGCIYFFNLLKTSTVSIQTFIINVMTIAFTCI